MHAGQGPSRPSLNSMRIPCTASMTYSSFVQLIIQSVDAGMQVGARRHHARL